MKLFSGDSGSVNTHFSSLLNPIKIKIFSTNSDEDKRPTEKTKMLEIIRAEDSQPELWPGTSTKHNGLSLRRRLALRFVINLLLATPPDIFITES